MRLREKTQNLLNEINHIIFGKEEVVQEIFLTMIGGGHILLEDIPGTGKTTLALAFSKLLDFVCKRVQFTPDVLPSDLVGFSVYKRDTQKFEYQKGAVFCNLLLADEINRTSPKTQAALLEAMEEGKITTDGKQECFRILMWLLPRKILWDRLEHSLFRNHSWIVL